MDDYRKPDKIEKLERRLYAKDAEFEKKPRQKLHQKEHEVERDWTDELNGGNSFKPPKKGMGIFTKILIGAFVFFLIALGYTFFVFNHEPNQAGHDINISINSPVSISSGENFTFDVIIENKNDLPMQSIDLAIEYPEGTREGSDVSINLPRERKDIGEIGADTFLRETRDVFLFGDEGETKEIEVKLVYRIPDSNAVFEKRKIFEVVLKSTPVRMNVATVKEITAGQPLTFDVEIVSNSNESLDNIIVKAEYPFGFIFGNSTIPTGDSDNVWYIDKIDPKEKITFTITGDIQGQSNELKFFKFETGLKDEERDDEVGVLFASTGKTISVQRPFLEIDLAIEGDNSSVINLDPDTINRMTVSYRNNTQSVIKDAELVLKLDGIALDKTSVVADKGFYNSSDNTIVWNKTTYGNFEQLDVGEGGTLELSFRSKPLTGNERFKNPEITFSAQVKGRRVQEEEVPEEIVSEVFKTVRYNTVVLYDQNSLYYDGPFQNSGPIPPKAEEETTYTIMFALSNSSNRISRGTLEMILPNYVYFKDQIWPSGQEVTYKQVDRKVTWDIGEIKENVGYNADKIEMAFQVGFIPSVTQSGSAPVLVEGIKFIGTDLFTGEQIVVEGDIITTGIADSRDQFDGQVSQ
jgi:hypothetical protein